jgi:hypothetical protein
MLHFPSFRSDEWVKELIGDHVCPPEVLKGVDLTPAYMASNPSAALYVNKARETREQMRRALFRHSLFKVQNVEVTSDCRLDRVLTSISSNGNSKSLSRDLIDSLTNDSSTHLVHEEIWDVDRCGSNRQYAVRYYREGDDGFSAKVFPLALSDKIAMLRYYFT